MDHERINNSIMIVSIADQWFTIGTCKCKLLSMTVYYRWTHVPRLQPVRLNYNRHDRLHRFYNLIAYTCPCMFINDDKIYFNTVTRSVVVPWRCTATLRYSFMGSVVRTLNVNKEPLSIVVKIIKNNNWNNSNAEYYAINILSFYKR